MGFILGGRDYVGCCSLGFAARATFAGLWFVRGQQNKGLYLIPEIPFLTTFRLRRVSHVSLLGSYVSIPREGAVALQCGSSEVSGRAPDLRRPPLPNGDFSRNRTSPRRQRIDALLPCPPQA